VINGLKSGVRIIKPIHQTIFTLASTSINYSWKLARLFILIHMLYKLGILSESFLTTILSPILSITTTKRFSELLTQGKEFVSKKTNSKDSYQSLDIFSEHLPIDIRIAKYEKLGIQLPDWLGRTITLLGLERITQKQLKKLLKHLTSSLHKEEAAQNSCPNVQNRDFKLIQSILKELETIKKSNNYEDFDDEDTS
jgi:predicted ribosome quality control (RQC) complex YloA/Tae2 family protein